MIIYSHLDFVVPEGKDPKNYTLVQEWKRASWQAKGYKFVKLVETRTGAEDLALMEKPQWQNTDGKSRPSDTPRRSSFSNWLGKLRQKGTS